MKTTGYSRLFLCTIIALVALLSGCNQDEGSVAGVHMSVSAKEDGNISYHYSDFTGFESESIQAETGQTIFFDYDTTVNKGSLIIEWQDPAGEVVWRDVLVESDRGADEIAIESPGTYTILIQGKEAVGGFDISWEIK